MLPSSSSNDDNILAKPLVELPPAEESSSTDTTKQEAAKPSQVDVSSVITQVTSANHVHRPTPFRVATSNPTHVKAGGWRKRVRSLLCCFAPQSQGYFRPHEGEGFAGRFGVPPQPPRVHRAVLIGPKHSDDLNKKTLVLDLDETLVHSSFKPIPNPGAVCSCRSSSPAYSVGHNPKVVIISPLTTLTE